MASVSNISPLNPVFSLQNPPVAAVKQPLVVDSPHSGTLLPDDFAFVCPPELLRQAEDSHVDRLGDSVPAAGGVVLKALVNRTYLDLNRALGDFASDDLDGSPPWVLSPTKRARHGIGLVHMRASQQPIYDGKLPVAELVQRVETIYRPYYSALEQELHAARNAFGLVLHVNLHAMPRLGADGTVLPDIVLGDHDGHSCGRIWRDAVRQSLEASGLKVVCNQLLKGVELTRRFARPRAGFHSLQIEVNKSLYMNEETGALTNGFAPLQDAFAQLWRDVSSQLSEACSIQHAAE